MMNILTFSNNRKELLNTNYWDSEQAKGGFMCVSINVGAIRLLVPDNRCDYVTEMQTASMVIMSRGPWPVGAYSRI
jgi:hypothetical protein